MGFGAIKLKAMETYVDQVYALLNGEIVEFEMEGERRKIRPPTPRLGAINTRDPIAAAPSRRWVRAPADTSRPSAKPAWINFVLDVDAAVKDVAAMRSAWSRRDGAGDERPLRRRCSRAAAYSKRVSRPTPAPAIAQAGPGVAVGLHIAADAANSSIDAAALAPAGGGGGNGYVAAAQALRAGRARYLYNHRGHLIFVKPEERPFLTAEAISGVSMTGTHAEICERIEALRAAGYTQVTVQLVHGHEDAINDWARIRQAFA